MEVHSKVDPNQRAFILTLAAALAATIFCGIQLLRIPSDTKNSFLFGLSKERLLMLSVFVVIFLLNLLSFRFSEPLRRHLSGNTKLHVLFRILAIISLFFVLMPDYRFGKAAAYSVRLHPFLLWTFLTSFIVMVFCQYAADRFLSIRNTLRNLLAQKRFILASAVVLICGILFVEISGLGKTAEASLWNKNGIPLQSIQLFCTLVGWIILEKIGFIRWLSGQKTVLNFLMIWILSAVIWSLAPLSPHFFAPGPYEPNQEYYPYSDAITYDIAAQTALNGLGFNQGQVLIKPAVTLISFITHLAGGNDFNRSMLIQSSLYAVLPAVIYLFGSAIGGASCGYLAAIFSLIKEWNALNTHSVLTVHSRLIMSEFLIQILLAVFCYAIFRWLQRDGKEIFYAALAGGSLTISLFTRYNMLAFIPASLLILGIAYRKNFRSILKPLLIFILTIFLVSAPMLIRSTGTSYNIFSEFMRTVQDVLIGQRFQSSETSSEPAITPQTVKTPAAVTPEPQVTAKSTETAVPAVLPQNSQSEFNTSQITEDNSNKSSAKNLPLIPSIINHAAHNFITSVLTLPMEITFQNLDHLYTQDGDGLWRDNWEGQFSARQWMMIGLWFIAGAVSIGILLHFHGISGFSILYFWLVYSFSIGFSRSSGGRYIVPCNWIPMLLLAFLCALLWNKGTLPIPTENEKRNIPIKNTVFIIASFTLFFGSMFLFEKIMPVTETVLPEGDLAAMQDRLADQTEIDWDLVSEQVSSGKMHLTHGIVLYPRFYYFLTGEHANYGSQAAKDYSRISFFGINGTGKNRRQMEYLLPHTEMIKDFPQDAIYRAFSCKSPNGYEDVLAVSIETNDGQIFTYVRDPLREFSCPAAEPVCISLENCR